MSASFLVGRDGQSWLDRPRAFSGWRSTRGGSFIKAGRARPLPDSPYRSSKRPSVRVAGLRGFVGVDFVCDTERRICHDPRDQPSSDDVVCRAVPVAPAGLAGPIVAGGLRADASDDVDMLAGLAGRLARTPRPGIV